MIPLHVPVGPHPGQPVGPSLQSRIRRQRMADFIIQGAVGYALMAPLAVIVFFAGSVYDGILTLFGLVFFIVFAPTITIGLVMVPGLLIRLVPAVRRWWSKRPWIGILGILLSVAAVIIAFCLGAPEVVDADGISAEIFVPQGWFLLAGWVMLAFFSTHIWFVSPRNRHRRAPRKSTA